MVVLNQQPAPRRARRDDLIALPSTWVVAPNRREERVIAPHARRAGGYGAGLAWCGRERHAAVEVQRCRPGFVSASAAPATSS